MPPYSMIGRSGQGGWVGNWAVLLFICCVLWLETLTNRIPKAEEAVSYQLSCTGFRAQRTIKVGTKSRSEFLVQLELFHYIFEGKVGLVGPLFERGQVFSVFREPEPHRLVHQVRYGSIGLDGLQSQCPVHVRVQTNGSSFQRRLHKRPITSGRLDVKTDVDQSQAFGSTHIPPFLNSTTSGASSVVR